MQPEKKRVKDDSLSDCFYKKRSINDTELRGGNDEPTFDT